MIHGEIIHPKEERRQLVGAFQFWGNLSNGALAE